ncbi:MAG TPA: glycosyltransferase [Bacteroidia bacterium]|nr:glycosyltransferase [Bacteroidia bacterium]
MNGVYSINNKEDFDLYFDEIYDPWGNWKYRKVADYLKIWQGYKLLDYALKNFDIFHIPYDGIFLPNSIFWKKEALILKKYGCKIVTIPYGGDFYVYSKLRSHSRHHTFLMSYPEKADQEDSINERVSHWNKYSDCIIVSRAIDSIPKWDILTFSILNINTKEWQSQGKRKFETDGVNGSVKIVHAPNHRGVKGTEFIVEAIKELKAEGILIDFILIEKMKNSEVKRILQTEADILLEQIIIGHGLNAIEGMACGLPVITNLEEEGYANVFRRFSFFNECPLVSATPEDIKETLRLLIKNPALRQKLGDAGKEYAEKYHSYRSSQYMFTKVYEKIWHGKQVDLINLYHPLFPDSYNNQSPKVQHPLIENKIK